jgi:hypothetical protein
LLYYNQRRSSAQRKLLVALPMTKSHPFNMNSMKNMSAGSVRSGIFLTGLLLSWLPVLALPRATYACACCSQAGEWSQISQPLSGYSREVLNSLQFATTADLDQSPAGTGAVASESANYQLGVRKTPRKWQLTFTDAQGKTGMLSIALPRKATFFSADIHDGAAGAAGGPLLYKEIRLEGKVTGTGIFAKGLKLSSKYRLIIQGRGNGCQIAENYRNWNLQISSGTEFYAFYGKF